MIFIQKDNRIIAGDQILCTSHTFGHIQPFRFEFVTKNLLRWIYSQKDWARQWKLFSNSSERRSFQLQAATKQIKWQVNDTYVQIYFGLIDFLLTLSWRFLHHLHFTGCSIWYIFSIYYSLLQGVLHGLYIVIQAIPEPVFVITPKAKVVVKLEFIPI